MAWKPVFLFFFVISIIPIETFAEDEKAIQRVGAINRDLGRLYEQKQALQDALGEVESKIQALKVEAYQVSQSITVHRLEGAQVISTKSTGLPALMRHSPNVNSEIMVELPLGCELNVIKYKPPLWKVEYQGLLGYVFDHYIDDGAAAKQYRVPKPEGVPETIRQSPRLESRGCCRVCKKGKPCGNSCISRSKQCHQPPGCAC